jgi:hypothetical protein
MESTMKRVSRCKRDLQRTQKLKLSKKKARVMIMIKMWWR